MPPEQAPSTALDNLNAPLPGPPPAQIVRRKGKDGHLKEIRGKLKRALDLMVWQGLPWNEAAQQEAFTTHAMRKALERPHVIRYLREQRQVFRASASAQNISRAIEIRDQDDNRTAAIQAIKYLDGIEERDGVNSAGKTVVPGVVVHIAVSQAPPAVAMGEIIEVNPAADMAQSQGTTDT